MKVNNNGMSALTECSNWRSHSNDFLSNIYSIAIACRRISITSSQSLAVPPPLVTNTLLPNRPLFTQNHMLARSTLFMLLISSRLVFFISCYSMRVFFNAFFYVRCSF